MRLSYEERIKEEYETLKLWLPENVVDILDIGCGYPLLDIWLARHYGEVTAIHLMDGDERIRPVHKEQVGYRQTTRPWKSRHAGVELLQQKVPSCLVQGHPPDPSLTIPCDLIVSRRAWGHHFSVKTYLDLVDRSLRPNGRIIIDIRIGTDGIKTFKKRGFYVIADNLEVRSVKCQRFALTR